MVKIYPQMTVLLTSLRILPSISKPNTHALPLSSSCFMNVLLNRHVFRQFILCSFRQSLRFCTAASLTTEVISGKIDVLVGSVTPLFTPPNQKLTNVCPPSSGELKPSLLSNKLSNETLQRKYPAINIHPGISISVLRLWVMDTFLF